MEWILLFVLILNLIVFFIVKKHQIKLDREQERLNKRIYKLFKE
jgi:hypothetical protein